MRLSRLSIPLLAAFLLVPPAVRAAPLLRCQVAYAGTSHEVTALPTGDPYAVSAADIGGRFRFKAVMIGDARRIDYIKLYAYYQGRHQPVLLHAAKYLPPWLAGGTPYSLTGQHSLYSPDLERELQFACTLEGAPS